MLTVKHTTENTLQFKYDLKTINRIEERRDSEIMYKLNLEQRETEGGDSLLAFCPIEVYERNFLRNMQQQQEREKDFDALGLPSSSAFMRQRGDENTMVSNSLQIPIISLVAMERPPVVENVYMSDNMTIIDTDGAPQVSNIFLPRQATAQKKIQLNSQISFFFIFFFTGTFIIR